MNKSEQENMEKKDKEIILWLERNDIPLERYKNLPISDKIVLRNLVCMLTKQTTYLQRRQLYRKLCLPGPIAGKDSIDPVDYMPDEELRKFFKPLAPSEKLHYLEKF